jgi:hypothetical protein
LLIKWMRMSVSKMAIPIPDDVNTAEKYSQYTWF